jgi:DNA primase small subunit
MTDMMIPDVDKVPTATTTKDDEEPEATMAMDVVIEAEAENEENEVTNPRTNSPTPETGRSLLSAPTAITPYHQRPTTTLFSTSSHKEEPAVTTPLLSLYYQHLFPYDFIYQWFRYGTGGATNSNNSNRGHHSAMNLFLHREFSFTIQNSHTDDEIYIRYQSFSNLNDFQAAIQKRLPIKIDIGAIFSHPPVQKHTFATSNNALSTFQPMEREFVLDIDLTDYDDVRNCGCQSANICPICWKYMYMAMETINTALYEDFQFQHVQWFYSGRRGIHGWVCDAAAKALTDQGRTAIANYLTVCGMNCFVCACA